MQLDQYNKGRFLVGASIWKQVIWYYFGDFLVRSRYLPLSSIKVLVLRMFGAQIGKGVRIKPGVRIKFPWKLFVGNHTWIGEDVWIDNLAIVEIGDHCCISQQVYLCTGSHNWKASSFQLITKPILIKNHVWVAAKAIVGPGVTMEEGAVLALGSTACSGILPWSVYQGNPATFLKKRMSD